MLGPKLFLFGPTARLCEDPTVHVEITPATEPEPEETIDEITDVSEQLALHSIISEERHNEILERVESCQQRLEQLSATESPSLTAIQAELSRLAAEVLSLKSYMDSKLQSPTPNELPVETLPEPEDAPAVVELIEEPGRAEPLPENQPPKKKNRFI